MKHQQRVSVRALVEHVLQQGDLVQELSETVHPTEAIKLHQKIQASRPSGYLSEVPISYQFQTEDFLLEVRGRIDGVLETSDRTLIEEIKTTKNSSPNKNAIHWGQAKVYSYLYAQERQLDSVETRLTYYLVKSGQTREFSRLHTLEELRGFFEDLIHRYLDWQAKVLDWVALRDQSIKDSIFPFQSYRLGQREMAVAVFKTIKEDAQLLVQAPTGIGKTVAVLFPAVKAIGEEYSQKIVYLTARTTGKLAVESTLLELSRCGVRLKSLTITAKQKTCFNPEQECNGEQCSFARGFYDRLQRARGELFKQDLFDRTAVEKLAKAHHLCPFEFSLELARWVDCIICDYNHFFDPRANIRSIFRDAARRHTLVVDEAHNLPERAREMFSSELEKRAFLELKSSFTNIPRLSKSMGSINWHLAQMRRQFEQCGSPAAEVEPPKRLYPKLRKFSQIAEQVLLDKDDSALPDRTPLLDLYFQVCGFLRVAERYDCNYVTCYQTGAKDLKLKLFCLDPSHHLKEVLKEGQSAIFTSATLTPLAYFQSLLGCSEEARRYQLPGPFPPENLCLTIADRTSTIYRERSRTRDEVAELLGAFVDQKPGNYLLFFPSYQYMNLILQRFPLPSYRTEAVIQTPEMTEEERRQFVARFAEDPAEWLVGFAVMGGVFGEGIDLLGERLTGAAVVGVGLPALCLERDLIRAHFDQKGLSGFDYAYRFPGLIRVLQAAGRVIRSEADLGAILLIDQRYARASYQRLLPDEWKPARVVTARELSERLSRFWAESASHSSEDGPLS